MRIHVNGEPREVPGGCTLADIAVRRPGVAAAVNGEVVRDWSAAPLADGDRVEVLTAFQGG